MSWKIARKLEVQTIETYPKVLQEVAPPDRGHGFQNVAREASIRFSGLAFDKVLGYLFALFVAKTYGSSAFGLYLFGIGICEVLLAVGELGLIRASIRAVAHHTAIGRPVEIKGIVRSVLVLSLPGGVLIAVSTSLLAPTISEALGRDGLAPFLQFAALSIPASIVAGAFLSTSEGLGRQRHVTIVRMVVEPTVKVGLTVCFFFIVGQRAGAGPLGVAYLASVATSAVLAIGVYRRVVRPIAEGAPSESHRSELLRVGLPISATVLLTRLLTWSNVFLIFFYASASATTDFAVAYRTALLTTMISTAFEAAFRPSITRALALGDANALRERFEQVARAVLILCLPICLTLVLFPDRVMVVLGEQFSDTPGVVLVVTLGTIVSFLAGPAASALTMAGRSRIPFSNGLVAGVVGVGTAILLIPRFGVLGAGIAQATTIILANVLNAIAAYRLYGVLGVGRWHFRIFVAGVVSVVVALAVEPLAPANKYLALVTVTIPLFLAYTVLLAVLGLMGEERRVVMGLIRRRTTRPGSE